MKTILFRTVLAPAMLVVLATAPAFAQSVVRGKVVDQDGNPVEGAVVLFEMEGGDRTLETKTNRNGEYQQLGLPSGIYKVTASKPGVGEGAMANYQVQQRLNPVLDLTLVPDSERGPDLTTGADGNRLPDEALKEVQAAVGPAFEAMTTQQWDTAIQHFSTILRHVPACSECHFNLAVAYAQSGRPAEAEQAFLKVIELEPESADAYRGLAAIYNSQKRFDDAAKANAKALELSGSEADASASADTFFNQGVILWNGGQTAEAKEQFEKAAAADPTLALRHYYIGLANLNLGQMAEARTSFEKYLELAPDGEKAAEVKAFVSQLK